jgi:D-alanyl-D-alanine carboxypeptidase
VESLLEAAFSSFALPADDPALRSRLAFAMLEEPLSPEAAAEPMLNGKPLSMILAAEAAAAQVAANDNTPAESAQGDADDAQPAPILAAETLPAVVAPAEEPKQMDPDETSIGRYYAEAPVLEEPAFSPEEYRRRQLAK